MERIKKLQRDRRVRKDLDRMLEIHEKLESYLDFKPCFFDKLKTSFKNEEDGICYIDMCKVHYPYIEIQIEPKCSEVLQALREFYAKRIIVDIPT